jgi:hypothetical protein
MRTERKLRERMNDWTAFEKCLFNAVSLRDDGPNLLFSQRMRVAQAMLDAMHAEVAVLEAERAAHLGPPSG